MLQTLKQTSFRLRFYLTLALTVLTAFTLLFVATPRLVASAQPDQPAPPDLHTIWQRVQQAPSYAFTADIAQTVYPAPTVYNVGRAPQTSHLYLEGTAQPARQELEMTLWAGEGRSGDPASGFDLRSDGQESFVREHGRVEWQPVGDLTGIMAPNGDNLAYLAAATNIQATPVQGELIRYTFDLDGDAFAQHTTQAMQQSLIQRGELPPTTQLTPPDYLRQLSGHGDLLTTAEGWPLSQNIYIALTLEDGQHLTADLASTFSGFDLAATPEATPLSLATLLPTPRATGNFSPAPALLATVTALFLVLAIRTFAPYWQSFWRSHRRLLGQWLGRAFATLMIFALVVPQLVHAEQVGAFYDTQRAEEAAQQSRQTETAQDKDLQEARALLENGLRGPAALDALRQDTGQDSDRDGLTDAQELVLGSNPFTAVSIPGQPDLQTALARPALTPAYLALAAQDSGQDSDSDGLTDYEETLLGTDPHGADSDGDGIPDHDEVVGFELNGRAYNTDPLKADSNEDGLDDGRERNTPNTPHATWDLDSDGTPDLFDEDNDGDGIPDRLDVSPMQVVTAVFGENAPLELALNGLTPGRVTYTEFQLRPTNPDQLRYAFNVYNWPDNDTSGQIRDTDGATFASLDPTLPTHPNSNGDLKLIPMLEIRATGDPNLPLRDTPAPLPALTVERLNRASNIEGNIQLNQTINGPEFVFNLQDLFGQPLSDSDYVYAIYSGSCARLGDEVSLARPAWGNTHLRADLNLGNLIRADHAILLLSENNSNLADPNLGLSCTDIPRQAAYGDRWVDTSLIQNYGISLSELAPNDYLIYSPIEMVSDSQTGERFGFYSKMVYQPTTSNWGAAQQVRLVWVVQGLLDEECRNGLCPDLNRLDVIQTYYSDWQLTGFSVEEHLTAEVGIIYEDPTAKNNLLGYNTVEQLAREEYLLGLAYELGYDWLEAPDCDTADANDRCLGDGQRDYTLPTIQSRLNDGVPTAERWFLPDIFGMETYQYSHLDEAWADVLSQRNTAVLNNAFGSTRNLFDPSLLFLSESSARTGNLDQRLDPTNPLATFDPSASRLTLDLSQQDAITTVAMSLAPYRYDLDQGGWQNADLATYLDGQFTTIYGPEWQDDVQAGALTPTEADGNLMLARLYYMALHEGLANAIAIGGVPLSVSLGQPTLKKTALFSGLEGSGKALKFLLNNLLVALAVVAGGYSSFSLKSLRTLLGTFLQENDVLKLGKIINLYQWDTSSKKAIAKTVLGNLGVTLLLVVVIVAVVALALAFAVLYLFSLQGQQWATITITLIIAAVQFFLAIILPIITVIKTAYAIKNTAGGFLNATAFVLSGPTYLTKNTIGAAIFGLIVEVTVLWGIFFYFWISQGLQPGSLAFNQALALTLAATIVAVFFFVLSLLTWGWLIVGALGAIDIVLMVLCNVANIAIACFSLRQLITQFVADSFYGADVTLDTDRTDLVRISGLKLTLQESRKGLVAGNQLVPSLTVTTNPHQNAVHMNAFQASRVLAHADKFFSASALREVTFRYSLNKPLPAVDLGQMRDEWQDVRVYDQLRVGYTTSGAGDRRVDIYAGTAVQNISADPITLTAGLNQPIPLTFHTSYAVPVAECWGASYLSTCKVQTAQGQQSTTNLGLVLDILPATLDEFAAFDWDDTLSAPRDADNDGLLAAAYNGLDPDDTRWDSDSDGLSDGYELDYRQRAVALDPNTADTDNDGLSDRIEIFVTNTNPTRPDSDGDGLSDSEEVNGWRFAYSADGTQTTLVTSDPTRPDSDGDGMNDRLEKELHEQYGYPFHPRIANTPIVSLETQTDLTRPFVVPGQSFRYTTTLTNNSKPLDNLWASGTLTTTTAVFNTTSTTTPFNLPPTLSQQTSQTLVVNGSAPTQPASIQANLTAVLSQSTTSPPWPPNTPILTPSTILLGNSTPIFVDTTPPTSAPTTPPNGGYLPAGQFVTLAGQANDIGSVVDLVEVTFQNVGVGWQTANGTNQWLYQITTPTAEGEYTFRSRATDAVGLVQNSPTAVSYILDGTAPTVQLDPTPSTPIIAMRLAENLWQLSFSGQATDPTIGANAGSGVAQVEVRLSPNGTGWHTAVLTDTNWTINYTLAQLTADGDPLLDPTDTYTVEVRARDHVGNLTSLPNTVVRTLRVDNRAPQSTLTHPAPAAVVAQGTTLTVTNDASTPVLASQPVISGTTTETGNAQAGLVSQEIRLIPADTGVAPGIWLGRYYDAPSFAGAPTLTRADETLSFDWGTTPPDPLITNDAFGVRWNRDTLFRVDGSYTFNVTHNAGSRVQVFIDNALLLDTDSAPTSTIIVDAGLHKLDVQYRTDGSAPANIQLDIQLDAPQFTPAALATSGEGVSSSSWRYELPAVTEGIYQIDLRATDVLGNRNDNLSTYNNWRGEIDTAVPRITLDLEYTGQGNSAQTTYRLLIQDFNLSEEGLTLPCAVRPENRYIYDSDWYADWFSGDNRLYQIYTTCTVPGHERTLPPITACDTYGQCTDYTNPNLPQPPNDSFLLWADGNALNRLDLTTLDSSVVATGPTLNQVELDSNHGRVYWTTATGAQSQIRRAEIDGTNPSTVYSENTAVALNNLRLNNQRGQLTYAAPDGFMHVTRSLDGAWLAASSVATDIIHPVTGDTRRIHTGESTFNLRWTVIGNTSYSTGDLVRYYRITRWGFPYGPGYRLGDHVPAVGPTGEAYCALHPSACGDVFEDYSALSHLIYDPLSDRFLYLANGSEVRSIEGFQTIYGFYNSYTTDPGFNDESVPFIAATASGDPGPAFLPAGLALDLIGRKLYIADTGNGAIWRTNLDGTNLEKVLDTPNPLDMVIDANRAPETEAQFVTTAVDTPVTFAPLASDPNYNSLAYTVAISPTNGTLLNLPSPDAYLLAPPTLTYTPTAGFVGTETIFYIVRDARGASASGSIIIEVTPATPPPSSLVAATIITPTDGWVQTSPAPLPVTIGATAVPFIDTLTLYANNTAVDSTSWANGTITDTTWTTSYTPPTTGRYTLHAEITAHDGTTSRTAPVTLLVDGSAPALTVSPLTLTTTHLLNGDPTLIPFRGTAVDSDDTVSQLVISVNGAPATRATLNGTEWLLRHPAPASPDGQPYTLVLTATDTAGRTTALTQIVTVDLLPPAPAEIALFSNGQPVTHTANIIRDLNPTLGLGWTASSDGAGIAGYYVGFTTSPTPTQSALTFYPAPTTHTQPASEATQLYAHVGTADTSGNLTWQSRPLTVDAPTTPDLIAPGQSAWQTSGASQIGADYEASLRDPSANTAVQTLHTSWNATHLRLTWQGADWNRDGDLFLYLDTAVGGTTTAHNPYATGETITLPSGHTPNWLIWVQSDTTAQLLRWDGSAWQTDRALATPNFAANGQTTDLYLPFSWLDITTPASNPLGLLALASEDDALRLWTTMPSHNPLSSGRVLAPLADPDALTNLTLRHAYSWPALAAGLRPADGHFDGSYLVFALDTNGATASFLGSDLYHLLTPTTLLDGDLDGQLDLALPLIPNPPPVGAGQTLTYTLTYRNLGHGDAQNVSATLTPRGGLSLPGGTTLNLGDIPAGATGSVVINGQTSSGNAAELRAALTQPTRGTFDWLWAHHALDTAPPTEVALIAPNQDIPGGLTRLVGQATDPAGLSQIEIEIAPPSGAPFTLPCPLPANASGAGWSCLWNAGTADGLYTLRANATDNNGNQSGWSAPFEVYLDSTPPILTLSNQTETAISTTVFYPNTAVFTGTLTDNRTPARVIPCTPTATTCTDALPAPSGAWSFSPPAFTTGDGVTQTVTLNGYDTAGNPAAPLTRTIRLDDVPPVITVTQALESAYLVDPLATPTLLPPVLVGQISDGASIARLFVELTHATEPTRFYLAELNDQTDDWHYAPRLSVPGTYTATLHGFDTAGNVTRVGVFPFTMTTGADLHISKTSNLTTTLNGDPLSYTIVVGNDGPSTINDAIVLDRMPAQLSGVSWTCTATAPSTCHDLAGTGDINTLVDLTPGHTVTFTIAATVQADIASAFLNRATVAPPLGLPDINPANNSATASVLVRHEINLSLSKNVTPSVVNVGAPLTYTLGVTHTSPSRVANLFYNTQPITITNVPRNADPFPSTLEVSGLTGTVEAVQVTLDGFTHNDVGRLDIALQSPDGTAVMLLSDIFFSFAYQLGINNAVITFDAAAAQTVPTPWGFGSELTVPSGTYRPTDRAINWQPEPAELNDILGPLTTDLTLFNNSDPNGEWRLYIRDSYSDQLTRDASGELAGWQLTFITSNGNSLTLTDTLPSGTTFQNATGPGWLCDETSGTLTCTGSAQDVPQQSDITLELLAPTVPGLLRNTAVLTCTSTTNCPPITATVTNTVAAFANLSLTKTVTGTGWAGYPLTYTLTAQNNGPAPVAGLVLTDTLPSELTDVAWLCSANNGATCPAPSGLGDLAGLLLDLPANSSSIFTITAVSPPNYQGVLTNTAVLSTPPTTICTGEPCPLTATTPHTITLAADLFISKTNGVTETVQNDLLTYTLSVGNAGLSIAPNVTVSDTLPAALSNANWTCAATAGATCTNPSGTGDISTTVDLAPGAFVTFTLSATVRDDAAGLVSNTAVVFPPATHTDPDPSNNQATDLTVINSTADLALSKEVTPTTAFYGDVLTYTLVVSNSGPASVSQIGVTDNLPFGFDLAQTNWTCTASPGSICPASGTGNITTTVNLAVNGTATFALTAPTTPAAPLTLTNTAQIILPPGLADPVTNNNQATAVVNLLLQPDVAIQHNITPTLVTIGQPLTYTLTISDSRPATASVTISNPLTVTSLLPAGATFQNSTGAGWSCSEAGGTLTCTHPGLSPNQPSDITVALLAPLTPSTLNYTAVVTPTLFDPNLSNNTTATLTSTVAILADLSLSQSVTPQVGLLGQPVTFTITARNDGPTAVFGAALSDALPTGLHNGAWLCTAQNGATCAAPNGTGDITSVLLDLPANGEVTFTFTADIQPAFRGVLSNTAMLTPPTGVLCLGDPCPLTATSTVTVPPQADLALLKSITPTATSAGALITTTLVAQNNGPDLVPSAVIQDFLPAEFTATNWLCTGAACPASSGTGDINETLDLAVGELVTYTAVSLLDPAAPNGTLTNTATISQAILLDPVLSNNQATATVNLTALVDLQLSQQDSPNPVIAGSGPGNLTYVISVTNNGPALATNATVSHTLAFPAEVNVVSLAPDTGSLTGGLWTIPALAPNATARLVATLTVGANAISGTNQITSTAVLLTADQPTVAPLPVTSVETTDIMRDINLLLTISETADPVTAGSGAGNLVYQLTAENQGLSPVSGVGVTATLALTTGITLDTVQPDASTGWDGVDFWTVGNLNSGESRTITFTLTADNSVVTGTQVSLTAQRATPAVPSNVAYEATTISNQAGLQVTVTAVPDPVVVGAPLTYTMWITNSGPSVATDVASTAVLNSIHLTTTTAGCLNDPDGHPTCALGTLLAGQSVSYTLTAQTFPQLTASHATINLSVDAATDGSGTGTSLWTPLTSLADLAVALAVAPDPAFPTLPVTYTLHITNHGPSFAIATPSLGLDVSAGYSYLNTGSCDEGAFSFGLFLDPGQSIRCVVVPRYDPQSTPYVVTATAQITSSLTPDPVLGNNTAVVTNSITTLDLTPATAVTSTEGNSGTTDVTVVITRPARLLYTTVDYQTVAGTAVAGSDYQPLSGTLIFPFNSPLTQTLTIPVVGDTMLEPDESFTLQFSNVTHDYFGDVTTAVVAPSATSITILNDDFGLPAFNVAVAVAPAAPFGLETDPVLTFTVTLTPTSGLPAQVSYTTADQTALAGQDYTAVSGTLTFPPGATSQIVTVPLLDDLLVDGDKTFNLLLSNPVSATIATDTAVGLLLDDESFPALSLGDLSVTEPAPPANTWNPLDTATITLTTSIPAPYLLDVTASYSSTNDTAVAPDDYQALSGTVTIPAGQTTALITTTITADFIDEYDETFTVTLSNSVYAQLAQPAGVVTILDNTPAPTVQADDGYVWEDEGSLQLDIRLLNRPYGGGVTSEKPVQFDYYTADNTAVAGRDYQPISGTLTITPGLSSVFVTIPIFERPLHNGQREFTLVITNSVNADLVPDLWASAGGMVTIEDSEDPPYITVGAVTVPQGALTATFPITVSTPNGVDSNDIYFFTQNNTAMAGVDYVETNGSLFIPAGITQTQVSIPLIPNPLADGDRTFRLLFSVGFPTNICTNPGFGFMCSNTLITTGTMLFESLSGLTAVNDSPTPLGTATHFTATLDAGSSVSYLWEFGDGSPAISTNVSHLSHTYGAAGTYTTTVTASNSQGALTATTPVTVAPLPALVISDVAAFEDTGVMSFTVALDAPSIFTSTVVYTTTTFGGAATAVPNTDYTAVSGTLIFPAGTSSQTITVPLIDNSDADGLKFFFVTLANPVNTTLSTDVAIGTIYDDESVPTLDIANTAVVAPAPPLTTTATFVVTLAEVMPVDVTFAYTTRDDTALAGADYQAISGTLTIPVGQRTAVINVPIYPNAVDQEDKTFFVDLANPSRALLGQATAVGTILDNTPAPTLQADDVFVWEDEGSLQLDIRLLNRPYGGGVTSEKPVQFDYYTADNTAVAGRDYQPISGTLTITPGLSGVFVTIPIFERPLHNGQREFTLVITNSVNADLVPVPEWTFPGGSVTIEDSEDPPYITVPAITVPQGALTATFPITVSTPNGVDSNDIYFSTQDDTAVAGTDYVTTTGSLFIPAGITQTQVTVPLIPNSLADGDRTFRLLFSVGFPTNICTNPGGGFWCDSLLITTGTILFEPLGDLTAVSSSPTPLGTATHFTATLNTGSNSTYNWDFGDGAGTASGATVTYTYATAGVYTATVTASQPGNILTTTTRVLVTTADLTLTLSDDQTTAVPGTPHTYTLTARNSGDQPTVSGLMADLPLALTDVSWTCAPTGGAVCPANGSGTFSDTVTLPPTSALTVTLTGQIDPSALGTLTATATIIPSEAALVAQTAVDTTALTPQTNLTLEKTASALTVRPGDTLTYNVVLHNAGPSTAFNQTISDNLPSDLTSSAPLSLTADLLPNTAVTLTIPATVALSAEGLLINTATAGNLTAEAISYIRREADLRLDKQVSAVALDAGDPISYTLLVQNAGPTAVAGAQIVDDLSANILGAAWTCSASAGASCGASSGVGDVNMLADLEANTAVTLTISGQVSTATVGLLRNEAFVVTPNNTVESVPTNNRDVVSTLITGLTDLSVSQTAPPVVLAGERLTYTIAVRNEGNFFALDALMANALPPHLSDIRWTCTNFLGNCPAPSGTAALSDTFSLSNGGVLTLTLGGVVDVAATGNLTHTVRITTTDRPETDTSNNTAVAVTRIIQPNALSLSKTVSPTHITGGQSVTYTLVVRNTDSGPLTAVLSDTLPFGTIPYSETVMLAGGETLTRTLFMNTPLTAEGQISNTAVLRNVYLGEVVDTAVFTATSRYTANQPPVADAGTAYTITEGDALTLDGSASFDPDPDDAITRYAWDLNGDGLYDDALGVTVPFTTTLDDLVTAVGLQVTDRFSGTHIATATVTISNAPPQVFAGDDVTIGVNQPITFTGSFTDAGVLDTHTVLWELGDGAIASDTLTTTHSYTSTGTFTVTLTITDDDGGVGSDALVVTVVDGLVADAGMSYTITEGDSLTLDGSGSVDTVGTITEYAWELNGDGLFDDAFGATVPFTNTADDLSTEIALRVTNNVGATDIATATVTINNAPPQVFVGDDVTLAVNQPITFTAVFTDVGVLDTHTVLWDLGDGTAVGDTLTPTHSYGVTGTFTVTLTVTDDDGGVGQASLLVTVQEVVPPPVTHTLFLPLVARP